MGYVQNSTPGCKYISYYLYVLCLDSNENTGDSYDDIDYDDRMKNRRWKDDIAK